MTLPHGRLTYKEYLNLPEDERYELVEGELLVTPAPLNRHQKILLRLAHRLLLHTEACDLGTVMIAPTDVVLSDATVLQPDVLFIRRDRESIIGPKSGIFGAPDLVVEILSPSTAERDLVVKRRLYETYGVAEYWIVDPALNVIEVLTQQGPGLETWQRYQASEILESPLLPGLRLDVSYILAE